MSEKRRYPDLNPPPTPPFNCRCVLVMVIQKPEQLDLFGSFVPATLGFQDLIKELKK